MPRILLVAALLLLAACTGAPRGVEPVTGFDPARYLGTWYSIERLDHRFERGLANVSATYSEAGNRIAVLNRGWDPEACEWREIEGTARFLRGPDTASLAVQFFWPLEGGYHVFWLDEDYAHAVVSGPTRGFLWLLARTPDPDPAIVAEMRAAAAAAGFDTDALFPMSHAPPVCARDGGAAAG